MHSTLKGHTDAIRAVTVTPDGLRAVSASRDQTLRIWNLETGKEIATFTGVGDMNSCTIAQTDRRLLPENVQAKCISCNS
jgi:WD40 repeat protein